MVCRIPAAAQGGHARAGRSAGKEVSRLLLNGNEIAQRIARFARGLREAAKSSVWPRLKKAYRIGYSVSYLTGIQTVRIFRFAGRRLARWLAPAGRLMYKGLDFLVLRHLRAIAAEAVRFGKGFPLAGRRVKEAFRRHPLHAVGQVLLLPFLAIRRHHHAVKSLLNLAAPVAAAFVLVATVNFWSNQTFALALEYNGETLGYISDESVFDSAAAMATDRVINTDNSFEVERTPKMTLAMVSKSDIMDEKELCDSILRSSSDSIAEVCGLYIDGEFEGSVQSRSELDAVLNGILDAYRGDGEENERVEFVQDVEIVEGLYPVSSIMTAEEMEAYLTHETVVDKYYTIIPGDAPLSIAAKTDMGLEDLRALNPGFDDNIFPDVEVLIQKAQPYLRVQVVRTVQYTESIAYTTKKIEDSSEYIGYQSVKTQGQEGERLVTAEVTYVDGLEQSRTVLSSEVTKEPVEKVVVVGAKKVNPNVSAQGDGISTGRFIWPLPSCKTVPSPFGYRWGKLHKGIDISGNGVYGDSIIAADGGTVVEVNTSGWGGGYGLYVIIDHGGGYRTMYAHCSSINVSVGQKVSQGQFIARVGQSGNITGPHLHFEVRVNGTPVDPMPYL